MEDAHGRLEHRELTVAFCIDDEGEQGKWKDLQTVIRYRCLRTIDNKTSESTRYYISSADAPASQFAYWIRNHWSIENKPRQTAL